MPPACNHSGAAGAWQDLGFGILLVSQFTLHSVLKGNRPDFHGSMAPDAARAYFADFVAAVRAKHDVVATGTFGAKMQVALTNDGPVTISLDSSDCSWYHSCKTLSPGGAFRSAAAVHHVAVKSP